MKNNWNFKMVLAITALCIIIASCASNVEEEQMASVEMEEGMEDPTTVEMVSFANQVKPIIDARCVVCHSPETRGIFPNLRTFAEVKARAERVGIRVGNGTMPQGGPLPSAQMQLIVDWVNEGALDN
ncbi:hypothetical protein [uncultured Polaribacter sp.]|uniref:hypothetical protein n=1 Tax=uncultured Polaribacter sp. TaxID=174711 RepID=UPI00260AE25D|nr:hypothetical protein [uncultured Polaribacter sp.]